jgi:Rrf2 family protein
MHTSKRCVYALRAVIDIGMAHEAGREVLPITEIAEHERIPVKFLEQILLQLRVAGYLVSRRGKHGGYALARSPRRIRIGELVRLIDGPLAPIACVSKSAYERCSCPDEARCGLHHLMRDVRNSVASILDKRTLHELVRNSLGRWSREGRRPFARDGDDRARLASALVRPGRPAHSGRRAR